MEPNAAEPRDVEDGAPQELCPTNTENQVGGQLPHDLYGLQVIADDGLRVPHPLMHKRAFVLVPLCDLEPDGRHPVLKQSYRVLAGAIGEEQELRRVQGLSLFPACVRGYSIGRPIHCH